MSKSEALWRTLERGRLIALLNPSSPEACVAAYETLAPLGVVLEIAFRSEHALPGIEAVLRSHPDAQLLAGTVLTRAQAEAALRVGVAGVVSADYVPGVVDACVDADVMCVPGGLADCGKQLVQKAELYGWTLEQLRERKPWQWVYKVFPAMADEDAVRETVKAWRAVYPGVRIVYTGGVTLENVGRLSQHDPQGIFCGSALTRHLDDCDRMRRDAERWLEAIVERRSGAGRSAAPAPAPQAGEADVPSAAAKGVVTFGEIMLRLSPPVGSRFRQATSFDVTYGGAEANVAVSLAQWGLPSRYVTVVPVHDLGQAAVDKLRSLGVDTSHVLRGGDRIGIYFLEHGASQRPSRVIYDRADSAVSRIKPGEVDWDAVFHGASWFHWTGITPALSESAAQVTLEAVRAAKRLGLTVSADLNYRSKLWSPERARDVMTSLVGQVDVAVGNEEDAAIVFGISAGDTRVERGELDLEAYESVARQLVERFGLRMAAITLRESHSASENTWSACLHDGNQFLRSRSYHIQLVDRVGGGDAFTAGLIYGTSTDKSLQEALEFGVAASCLKQTITGDFNLVTVAEVEKLVAGEAAGRIKR
ncbi:MAG: KHG/KDPG aldolase/sugar kinase fusion protein [Gemmatimonadales bacterium]